MSDDKVVTPFFRDCKYDEMTDKLDAVIDEFAGKVSRCEVVGCLEFIKHRIVDDEDP